MLEGNIPPTELDILESLSVILSGMKEPEQRR